MSKDTGGPAFPSQTEMRDGSFTTEQGMTLRDYFASAALMSGYVVRSAGNDYDFSKASEVARHMYDVADAMLLEREK